MTTTPHPDPALTAQEWMECMECYALVTRARMPTHRAWHHANDLRQALRQHIRVQAGDVQAALNPAVRHRSGRQR